MNDSTKFTKLDWVELTPADKKALKIFANYATDFEPLAKLAGVGQKSMDDLIRKELAVEGEKSIHGRTFKITDKGWLALSWIQGQRIESF